MPTWPVEKPKTYRGGGVSPVVSLCGGGVSLCDNAAPLSSLGGATPFASLDGDAMHFSGRAHGRVRPSTRGCILRRGALETNGGGGERVPTWEASRQSGTTF